MSRAADHWQTLLDHLSRLEADPAGFRLVAALVHGERATFTVAEAALLLSVSAKHLYANAAATGQVTPGVDAIRSGDRLSVPAHQLRARIGLPEPHRAEPGTESRLVEHLPPALLQAIADTISWAALVRLDSAGEIRLPDRDTRSLRLGLVAGNA